MRRYPTPGIDFEWRSDSLIFNLFRVCELFFGVPVGVRKTASVVQYEKDGRIVVERAFYTWEALLSYYEISLYSFFRTLKLPRFEFVPVVQLAAATPFGPASVPIYSFAVARDVNSAFNNGTGTTTKTFTAVNVTGSNPAVFIGLTAASSDTATGATFNSVAMAQVGNVQKPVASRFAYLYYLAGTSGNASCAVTFSAEPDFSGGVTSAYSGVASGAADSSNTGTSASASTFSVATTVVATNCWLAGWFYTGNTGIAAGTATSEVADNGNDNLGFYDSNATVGTGSQSLEVTCSVASTWAGAVASFAPAAAAGASAVRRMLMGIGS